MTEQFSQILKGLLKYQEDYARNIGGTYDKFVEYMLSELDSESEEIGLGEVDIVDDGFETVNCVGAPGPIGMRYCIATVYHFKQLDTYVKVWVPCRTDGTVLEGRLLSVQHLVENNMLFQVWPHEEASVKYRPKNSEATDERN